MRRVEAICLLGPTGTGKTELSLRIAAGFDVEIISVDSAMVFRGMDIGTAKPDARARDRVPHHLIDIRDPWEGYSAGQFCKDAHAAMSAIRGRGRMPLLVGGTMLYFRALLHGLADLPGADPEVRAAIDSEARQRGWPEMHTELERVDPVAARRIKPTDRQRIQRALEVFRISGQPISALQGIGGRAPDPGYLRIALVPSERGRLYGQLDERLAGMMRAGLVSEVERLRKLPLMSAERPAMRAVGYRQVWDYLEGKSGLREAERRVAVATHRLAKRQLTWLRSEPADMTLDTAGGDGLGQISGLLDKLGVSRLAR